MNRLIVNLKIKMGLKTNYNLYLKDARELNNLLLTKVNKMPNSLRDEINSNKLFLDAIEKNKVKTIVEFEVPSPMPVQENNPIEFEFKGIKHILNIEIIENPASNIKGTGISIPEDKYGLVKRSKINLTIFKYIDPDERVELKNFSNKNSLSKRLVEAINALNYFIERYRIVTGKYWVETVYFNMIPQFKSEIKLGNQRFGNLIGIYDQSFFISARMPYLSNDKIAELNNYLKREEIPLWETLLLDGKDYLLLRNYREAIYAINGAFENYLMLKAREVLTQAWDKEKADEYLDGVPVYEYHKLNGYMDEESFKKAVNDGKVGKIVPPTGQILKEVYNVLKEVYNVPNLISHNKLDKLDKKIRKMRNEVMHGVEIDVDLEIITFEAIKSFEEFVKLFEGYTNPLKKY